MAVDTIGSIKSVAELQGQPVGTAEIVKSIRGIGNTITNRINQLTVKTAQSFLPVTEQIQQINELLVSPREEQQDQAYALIQKLQERLGIDLGKFSTSMQANIQKLYELNNQQKADKAEREQIHTNKIEELKQEREILRERGINTIINEKTYQLELQTAKTEREEKISLIEREKELQIREKRLKKEAKDIQKDEVIDKDREEKFLEEQRKLTNDQLQLQEDKDKQNQNTQQQSRSQGFLGQTFGAAGTEIKNSFLELALLGKTVGKAFSGIPKFLGGFVRGIGSVAKIFGRLMVAMLPLVLTISVFALLIAALVYAIIKVYKIIMDVVDTIKDKVEDIKQMFTDLIDGFRNSRVGKFLGLGTDEEGVYDNAPPGLEDFNKNKEKGEALSKMDDFGYYENPLTKGMDLGLADQNFAFDQLNRSDGSIVEIPTLNYPTIKSLEDPKVKFEDMKSTDKNTKIIEQDLDNLLKEKNQSSSNTVIAPTTTSNSTNVTQAISMSSKNLDPSFINLQHYFSN